MELIPVSWQSASPQVTLVINPVVGGRYFSPGQRLLSQPKRSPPPLNRYQTLLGDRSDITQYRNTQPGLDL